MASRDSARKFHFLREIASGGFGSVYLAKVMHADGFSRIAAVKLLHRRWSENREIAQRMRDEARLLGWLRHRNIVDVIDLTSIDGRAAVIMEYLEAVDLKTVVQSLGEVGQVMPARSALEVVSYVASALDAAYNRPPFQGEKPLRVIHRDIKPSNIMVDEAGTVKVLDFGVARAEFENRESHTQELQFGSVDYMPPERLFFEPETDLSDVYSLGATLYEVLAGVKLGKAKGRAEKHAVFLEDRLSFLAARNPLTAPHGEAVLGLVRAMCAYVPDQRPRATDVVTRCRALVRAIEGELLSEWAEHAIPPMIRDQRDADGEPNALQDAVLSEDSVLFSPAELQTFERIQELAGGVVVGHDDAVPAEIPRDDGRWELLRKAALAEMAASGPKPGAEAQRPRPAEPAAVPTPPAPPPPQAAAPGPARKALPVSLAAPDTSLGGEPAGMETTVTGTGARAAAAVSPTRHAEPTAPGRTPAAADVIDPTLSALAPPSPALGAAPVLAPRALLDLFEEEPTRVGHSEDGRRPPSAPIAVEDAAPLPVSVAPRVDGSLDESPAFPSPRRPTSAPDPAHVVPANGASGPARPPTPPLGPVATVNNEVTARTETLANEPTRQIVDHGRVKSPVPPPPVARPENKAAPAPAGRPVGPSPAASRQAPVEPEPPPPSRGGLYLAIAVVFGGLAIGVCTGVGWIGWRLYAGDAGGAVETQASTGEGTTTSDAKTTPAAVESPADPGPDAVRFQSAAADTQRLTVTCGGKDYSGTTEVAVPGPKAGDCSVRLILKDRSRLNAQVAAASKGTYRCFVDGAKTCVR